MRKIRLKPYSQGKRAEEEDEVERFFPDLSEEDEWFLKDEELSMSELSELENGESEENGKAPGNND